eukprot:9492975-Lingulodinium_polyedra.AAC.1
MEYTWPPCGGGGRKNRRTASQYLAALSWPKRSAMHSAKDTVLTLSRFSALTTAAPERAPASALATDLAMASLTR